LLLRLLKGQICREAAGSQGLVSQNRMVPLVARFRPPALTCAYRERKAEKSSSVWLPPLGDDQPKYHLNSPETPIYPKASAVSPGPKRRKLLLRSDHFRVCRRFTWMPSRWRAPEFSNVVASWSALAWRSRNQLLGLGIRLLGRFNPRRIVNLRSRPPRPSSHERVIGHSAGARF